MSANCESMLFAGALAAISPPAYIDLVAEDGRWAEILLTDFGRLNSTDAGRHFSLNREKFAGLRLTPFIF
jgi:hypothetical protein